MDRVPFTPQACELGEELRDLRTGHANGRGFADQLGWDPSKVSNIEHGKILPTELDLAQYLSACGMDRDCISDFNQRFRTAFDPYFAQQPSNFTTIAFAERMATTATCYGKATIPALIRTDKYTRTIMRQCGATPQHIQAAIASQQERQRLLRTKRPRCVFYITESAISTQLDHDGVMIDQLKALKRLSQWEIRIVPDDDAVPFAVDFTVYEYEKMAATAFIDCDIARVFIRDDSAISRCRTVLAKLDDTALSRESSKELLTKRCEQLCA